jgi:hypothetical protein
MLILLDNESVSWRLSFLESQADENTLLAVLVFKFHC